MDRKAVHAFAGQFLGAYRGSSPALPISFYLNEAFGESCERLGFAMDCGEAFIRAYSSRAFFKAKELALRINSIHDAALLGSAIFSKWRYLTRWCAAPLEQEEEHERWFLLTFLRLEQLTAGPEAGPCFRGRMRKFRIAASAGGLHAWTAGEKLGERLTVCEDGRVCRTEIFAEEECGEYRKKRTAWTCRNRRGLRRLFEVLTLLARSGVLERGCGVLPCDGSSWAIKLWTRSGVTAKYGGSLWAGLGAVDLSELVRQVLGHSDLWAFGAGGQEWDLVRVEMTYRPAQGDCPPTFRRRAGEGMETLVLDRGDDRLTYCRCGAERKQSIILQGGVAEFLSQWDDAALFAKGGPAEPVCVPDAFPSVILLRTGAAGRRPGTYVLTVRYRGAPKVVWEGCFQQDELPEGWAEFAEEMRRMFTPPAGSRLLDPAAYNWRPRRPGESIYCHVVFEEGGKTYCYRTEDESIRPGDRVLVPVGPENETKAVTVVRVEYVRPEDAPYPPAKTKIILGKVK